MDKKKVIKYIGITFLISWTLQIIGSVYIVKNNNMTGLKVFQGALLIVMFSPMIAALITNRGLKGMGWKPKLKGNIKWILFSMFVPMIITILGFVCFFLVFPDLFALDGSYLMKYLQSMNVDAETIESTLAMFNMDIRKVLILSIIQVCIEGPFINMFAAIGEEAGWRGFLYPELIKGFGRVKTWIIGGIIWGAFHFPCMLIEGYEYGLNYIGAPVLGLIVFTIFCIALGIMEEVIYDKTKCIWYPALLHGSINAAATTYQLILNGNQMDRIERLQIFGPSPGGIIAGIPILIISIVIGVWALKSKERND
ncbi:MAG: CPBP family intramembrane metalloprotease [Eubacterium sp.]|nr:CPBP family intramembrane metalloprotease [Eubacterium sp.]